MGQPKDQPHFKEDEAQKTLAEGPKFDFLDSSVLKAEDSLRSAVTKLKNKLEYFSGDFNRAQNYFDLCQDINLLVPELYLQYDGFVREVLKTGAEKVTCGRSCSHCCSHYVTSIEPFELIFIHGKIRTKEEYPDQIISLHRRTSLFKSLLKGGFDDKTQAIDEDKALFRYYLRGQACPFLSEDGACGIYEYRPMSCRMFYSLSHPTLCKGKSVIAPGNRNFLIELPDDIEADLARTGALFNALQLPESLFEGLLAVNEAFGRFDSEHA